MHNKKVLPFEKPLFLSCITFIGGYMNAYTYITRNQILANMHTANMSKLGIKLALGQFKNALSFFIPILACILGTAFSSSMKYIIERNNFKGDWRKFALLLESIALFGIGLIPPYIKDLIVTNLVSFWMGYQLCLFKKCLDSGFSTTICTGNIRTIGELLFNALIKEDETSLKNLIIFTMLTFSFAFGAFVGSIISTYVGATSVWFCSFLLLIETFYMYEYELKNKDDF